MLTNDYSISLAKKYGNIRLLSVSTVNERIKFLFLVDEKFNISDKVRGEIENFTVEFFSLKTHLIIEFRLSHLLEDLVNKCIVKFCISKFLVYKINSNNIEININGKICKVVISLPLQYLDFASKTDLANIVQSELNSNFFASFGVVIREKKGDIMTMDLLEARDRLAIKETLQNKEKAKNSYYQVLNIEPIYGKRLIDKALNINKLCKDMKDVYVAGTIENFTKRTYNKKYLKEGKEISEEKVRYNFDLRDSSAKISSVIFPSKPLLKKGDVFENGQTIIALCDVSEFNDRLSIRIKEVGFCEIPNDIDIEKFFSTPANYSKIEPQKYEDLQQIDLWNIDGVKIPRLLENKTFVVFDLETTGLFYNTDEILEIGAVKVVNGVITETFNTLVHTDLEISKEVIAINGITNEMVSASPTIEQVLPDFAKFCENSIMVAHNADFDKGFLVYHSLKCKWKFDNEFMDTLALSRQYIKGLKNYKLQTICNHFNIDLINAHRALNDTVATAKCFIKIAELMR